MSESEQSPPKWPHVSSALVSSDLAERDLILIESIASEDLLLIALWLEGIPDFSDIESAQVTQTIARQLRQLAKFSKTTRQSTRD